jgi:3-dehydroquinate synthase
MNFCRKATTHASQPKYTGLDGPQTLEIEQVLVRKSTIHLAPHCIGSESPPLNLLVDNKEDPFVIVTDETVNDLYTRDFAKNLKAQGANLIDLIVLPASEAAKSLQVYTDTLYRLEANEACTGSVTLVAVGGAVVSNVTGYLASTLKRGVRFVSMPTTLLAQCDGCISFKQAVNGRVAKNQFGAYYAASNIVLDMQVLDTLPDRNFLDGFGEVIKHALCQDMKMVGELENIDVAAMLLDRSIAYPLIWKAVQCKLQCMEACPPENHAVLQYGHQYGHGVEKAANFEYGHGECVGIGMVATDYLGMLLGHNDSSLLERTTALVEKYGLPTCIGKSVPLAKVWDAMVHDKAFVNGQHRVNFAQPVERNHEFQVIPHELVRQGLSYISSYEFMFYNGATVPKVAFSTTASTSSEEVEEAIEGGVRHFVFSTSSSPEAFATLASALNSSTLTRDQVTISLSCVTDGGSSAKAQCSTMLASLGVEAADLVKLHVSGEARNITDAAVVATTWQGMEVLVQEGLTESISLSNCSTLQLEVILATCAIKPVSLDIANSSMPIDGQLAFCEDHNIRLVTVMNDVSAKPSAEVMEFSEVLNKTDAQLLLRSLTTRGVGIVLEGNACQDLSNFDLDFTIPSEGFFYSTADSTYTTDVDTDADDEPSLRGVSSSGSLFSLGLEDEKSTLRGVGSSGSLFSMGQFEDEDLLSPLRGVGSSGSLFSMGQVDDNDGDGSEDDSANSGDDESTPQKQKRLRPSNRMMKKQRQLSNSPPKANSNTIVESSN